MDKEWSNLIDDLMVAFLMIINPIVWVLCILGMVKLWLEGRERKREQGMD